MAKIWLKIWLKVKENGTKKNQIGENGGERKKNPSANPVNLCILHMLKDTSCLVWSIYFQREIRKIFIWILLIQRYVTVVFSGSVLTWHSS